MTKSLKLILAGCLAALTMAAADASGKWTAEMPGRDGNTMTITMNLKADGDKLTGTVSGRRGDSDISEGKLDGDTIHFTIKMEGGMGGGPGRKGGQDRTLDAHRSTT